MSFYFHEWGDNLLGEFRRKYLENFESRATQSKQGQPFGALCRIEMNIYGDSI